MVNVDNIKVTWQSNPNYMFKVIKTPKLDMTKKKDQEFPEILGLDGVIVDYRVETFSKQEVKFVKVSKGFKDFPKELIIDARYPDFSDEVESNISNIKKSRLVSIFSTEEQAKYAYLRRFYLMAESMVSIKQFLQDNDIKLKEGQTLGASPDVPEEAVKNLGNEKRPKKKGKAKKEEYVWSEDICVHIFNAINDKEILSDYEEMIDTNPEMAFA